MSISMKTKCGLAKRVSKEECERIGIPCNAYGDVAGVNFKHLVTEEEFATIKSVFERMGVKDLLDCDGGFLADMQLTNFAPLMAKLPMIAAQSPYIDNVAQVSLLSELLYNIQKNQDILSDLAHLLTQLYHISEHYATSNDNRQSF